MTASDPAYLAKAGLVVQVLLFLKMGDEQTKLPGKRSSVIPKGKKGERYDSAALLAKDGEALDMQYRATLEYLYGSRAIRA